MMLTYCYFWHVPRAQRLLEMVCVLYYFIKKKMNDDRVDDPRLFSASSDAHFFMIFLNVTALWTDRQMAGWTDGQTPL